MSGSVPSKTDLMYEIVYNPEFIPIPSPKVNVKTTDMEGKLSYLMKNHATGVYYELDELMNLIWGLTDGKRTVKEIFSEVYARKPRAKENDARGILLFFADANLLVSRVELSSKKRLRVASAFEIDLAVVKQSKFFLQSIHNKVHSVLKRPFLWMALAFIFLGVMLFSGRYVSILGNKSDFQILGSSVVGFFFYTFVALAPVVAIHEIAHGLALVHYGGEPGEMGTGLFYFGPMFYTETTDAWSLPKKQRMVVYFAGILSTLLIGSTVILILLFVKFAQPTELILTMVAFYCFDMSLFNLAPPFETDGYFILSDALNMPSLRSESYGYLGSHLRRVFGKDAGQKTSSLTRRKRTIYVAYAMLSVGWILYIIFHASLILSYMSQDLSGAVSSVLQAAWSSQALPASALVIAALSTVYFGMQILGYGSLFASAVKKATRVPLRVEAIPNRILSVFAYLPPQSSESLSNGLRTIMEKTAKKFTHNYEVRQAGNSCIAVLRMGGAKLAFTQIKDSLKRVEDEFSAAYKKLVLDNKRRLQETLGIHSSGKVELTRLLDLLAKESVCSGNSGALTIAKACENVQAEAISYLLASAFGTVWSIEVQPAHEYEIEKEMMPTMLLGDLTLTDLYGDVENFKKRVVYGFDSLAKLAEDTQTALKESLAQPQQYQLVGMFEPIKSRITFVGRTNDLEDRLHVFGPYFVAETWSGYLDNLLTETCCRLDALGRVRVPPIYEMKLMSIGELAVLLNDLSEFEKNQGLIDKCVAESEQTLLRTNQAFQEMRDTIKPSADFDIGMLDAAFSVNVENIEALPSRIRYFRKEWKAVSQKLERIKDNIEEEYEKRKVEISTKKRNALKRYPAVVVLSVLFGVLCLLPPLTAFWPLMLSVSLGLQVLSWFAFCRLLTSFRRVTKYPSETFSRIHLLLLAWTEAIYGYVATGDTLSLS